MHTFKTSQLSTHSLLSNESMFIPFLLQFSNLENDLKLRENYHPQKEHFFKDFQHDIWPDEAKINRDQLQDKTCHASFDFPKITDSEHQNKPHTAYPLTPLLYREWGNNEKDCTIKHYLYCKIKVMQLLLLCYTAWTFLLAAAKVQYCCL